MFGLSETGRSKNFKGRGFKPNPTFFYYYFKPENVGFLRKNCKILRTLKSVSKPDAKMDSEIVHSYINCRVPLLENSCRYVSSVRCIYSLPLVMCAFYNSLIYALVKPIND